MCASNNDGHSPKYVAQHWLCLEKSNGERRRSRRRNGGRKSATASFSTTTKTRKTVLPVPRIRCGRFPTPEYRRRFTGTKFPTAIRPTLLYSPCRSDLLRSV